MPGTDPDLFWPEQGFENQVTQAKAICRNCPVRALCRDYALQHRIPDGIWGGMTVTERRQLRRDGRTDAA